MAKLCPKCGQELNSESYCENCRKSFKVYDKILVTSKLLYNQGLQLAKVRDLSGCINVLQRSVRLNKNNIDARNLLGLAYFEIGETVPALQQWVISKNLGGSGNEAEKYLKMIQENQTHLDKLGSAIKKYNQALTHIQQGSEDLAVIQLKKVISLNPNFIKAYTLLALCYIKGDQNQKASRMLQKVLSIDKNNYIATKYLDEITDKSQESKDTEADKEESFENGTMVHHVPNFLSSSFHQLLYVAFGALIGLAVALFLISPSRVKEKEIEITTMKEQAIVQANDIKELSEKLEAETTLRSELEIENAQLTIKLDTAENTSSESAKMLAAIQANSNKDYLGAANALYLVDAAAIDGTELKDVYNTLVSEVYTKVAYEAFNQGYVYYTYKSLTYYEKAVEQLDIAIKFMQGADYADQAYYYRGVSHYNLGHFEDAKKDLEMVIKSFPQSGRVETAQWYLDQM